MVTVEDKLNVFYAMDELRDAGYQLEACLTQDNPRLREAAVNHFHMAIHNLEVNVDRLTSQTPNK